MAAEGQNGSAGAPLLDIRDLRIEGWDKQKKSWSPILHGVDLQLRRGEIIGLVGESGAGKSMLGLSAMGYTRPGCRIVSGSILFDGIDLASVSEDMRRSIRGSRVAYVAQSAASAFNPAHRLVRQLGEVAVVHGLSDRQSTERQVKALLARLRLPNPDRIGERFPHQLSGGQLQRAMTAMAMTCAPELIIFDEPTTALDVTTQVEVLASIRDAVRGAGAAAIFISHDLAVVAQMADRIKILRNGRTVEEADTGSILAAPKEEYTRSLWAVRHLSKPVTAPASDVLLSVRGVSASYGKLRVLHDISLDIRKGRTMAAVGESGSGKSTLGRVMTGLLAPDQGAVELDGVKLGPTYKRRSLEDLRRIQLVYQSPDTALNPRQTIREVLGQPLRRYFGITGTRQQEKIRELLELVELPGQIMNRRSHELSGGQKQRLCIARALAAEPDLIICDEITSGLDQLVAESILKLLAQRQKELGVSYFFITHDLTTVDAIADEVIVMKDGRIVEASAKDALLQNPRSDYARLLLASVPEMDPTWLTRLLGEREAARA